MSAVCDAFRSICLAPSKMSLRIADNLSRGVWLKVFTLCRMVLCGEGNRFTCEGSSKRLRNVNRKVLARVLICDEYNIPVELDQNLE